ncbi:MAG TPA: hypothetical protein VF614_00765 [Chthoniobacteraceae bacterium]|jgi:hypothetical protein
MTTFRASFIGGVIGSISTLAALAIYVFIYNASPDELAAKPFKRVYAWFSGEVAPGGPIILLLYLLMFLSFALSLILPFRRPASAIALAPCIFPTLFGALAMLVNLIGSSALFNHRHDRNLRAALMRVPHPFLLGLGMSAIEFTVYALTAKPRGNEVA